MQRGAHDALQVTRHDPAGLRSEGRLEAWCRTGAQPFDKACVGEPASFSAGATCCLVDTLIFTRVRIDSDNHRSGHQPNYESDCITLQPHHSGSIWGQLGDGASLLKTPDCIAIRDHTHADSGVGEQAEQYGVVIPHGHVAQHDRVYQDRPVFSWAMGSPQGRLLINAVAAIWRELPLATRADASPLASGFIGLLNGLLVNESVPAEFDQVERTSATAIQEYLRANLRCGNIDVGDLCREFNCSRATLYRLFRDHGGVKTYLRNLRLEQCFQEFGRVPESSRGYIRKVAERWGFYRPSQFYRLFKQRFGITPSEALLSSHFSGPQAECLDLGFLADE